MLADIRSASPSGRGWTLARSHSNGDAFRMMYGVHPAIEGLHALRDALGVIVRARIPIGPRRSQPAEPVSVRHRHRPQCPGQEPVQRTRLDALVHEVRARQDRALSGLANPGSRRRRGAQSGDRALMEDYLGGDIYHALAKMCGLTNVQIQALEERAKDHASG